MTYLIDVSTTDVKAPSGIWPATMSIWHGGSEVSLTGLQVLAGEPAPVDPPTARFYGDPGESLIYVGGHEPVPVWPVGQTTLATRYEESTYGPIGIVRRFYQDSGTYGGMAADIADDKAAGRIPWVSFKPGGTFYGRTAAQKSARYTLMLAFLTICNNADWPVIASVFHEPENDTTSVTQAALAADWLELQTQWAAAKAEVGAVKVTTASVLMSYTFRTASGRPYATWVAAGAPCDIQGIDYYAYATNVAANRVLVSAPLDDVLARTDSRPIMFAELGQTRSIGTTQWEEAMSDFYDLCAAEPRIVGSVYFDSEFNSVESWPFTAGERTWYNNVLRQRAYSVVAADVLA